MGFKNQGEDLRVKTVGIKSLTLSKQVFKQEENIDFKQNFDLKISNFV